MKRTLGGIALGAVAAVSALILAGHVSADDKYDLVLKHPEGRAVVYKNNSRYEYISDHGHQILKEANPPEWVELVVDGEWRSREVVEAVVESTGTATISATLSSAFSAASKGAQRLSYTTYPSRLEELREDLHLAVRAIWQCVRLPTGFRTLLTRPTGFGDRPCAGLDGELLSGDAWQAGRQG